MKTEIENFQSLKFSLFLPQVIREPLDSAPCKIQSPADVHTDDSIPVSTFLDLGI